MNLMDMFRSITGANQFAAPGQQGNFGDGLQGIGHSLAQWARYGQGDTPEWAQPKGQAGQTTPTLNTQTPQQVAYAAQMPPPAPMQPQPVMAPVGQTPGMGIAPISSIYGSPIGTSPTSLVALQSLLGGAGRTTVF